MKTLPQLNAIIQQHEADYNALPNKTPATPQLFDAPQKEIKKRDLTKYMEQLEFLKRVRNYFLLTGGDESSLTHEVNGLRAKISEISKRTVPVTFYPANFKGNRSDYFNKHMGINDMMERVKIIDFILC